MQGISPMDPHPDLCTIFRSGYNTFKGNKQLFRPCPDVNKAACPKLRIIETHPAQPLRLALID
jgi:hypothetical protein